MVNARFLAGLKNQKAPRGVERMADNREGLGANYSGQLIGECGKNWVEKSSVTQCLAVNDESHSSESGVHNREVFEVRTRLPHETVQHPARLGMDHKPAAPRNWW